MKPLIGYLFLSIAISFGIVSNSFAKISDGFTKLTPSILCILFMCITMFQSPKLCQLFQLVSHTQPIAV